MGAVECLGRKVETRVNKVKGPAPQRWYTLVFGGIVMPRHDSLVASVVEKGHVVVVDASGAEVVRRI